MANNKRYNYFEGFIEHASYCSKAAELLYETLGNFENVDLDLRVKEMHEIEHSADIQIHSMTKYLLKDFLPPIEREDIVSLSQKIDNVTDAVEDVLIKLHIYNIKHIIPEVLPFASLVRRCCETTSATLVQFQNFKKSTKLQDAIIELNRLEEEGDALYAKLVRDLHMNCKDPIELFSWTRILDRFETCCDACEDVADDIESIVLKNS